MDEKRVKRARELVASIDEDIDAEKIQLGGDREEVRLARRIWLASALLGSASAQEALASSLLDESFNVVGDDPDAATELRLLGAVFCGLAAAQDHPDAIESAEQLFRLVAQSSESEADFEENPVTRTLACVYY